MSSDENLTRLGNCIIALEEEADKLRKHAEALLKNRSRFEPDHLSLVATLASTIDSYSTTTLA